MRDSAPCCWTTRHQTKEYASCPDWLGNMQNASAFCSKTLCQLSFSDRQPGRARGALKCNRQGFQRSQRSRRPERAENILGPTKAETAPVQNASYRRTLQSLPERSGDRSRNTSTRSTVGLREKLPGHEAFALRKSLCLGHITHSRDQTVPRVLESCRHSEFIESFKDHRDIRDPPTASAGHLGCNCGDVG